MSYVCDICGKESAVGGSQQHRRGIAGRRWKKRAPRTSRIFKPNLQKITLIVEGQEKKMRICAKCLKRIRKYGSIKNYSKIAVA